MPYGKYMEKLFETIPPSVPQPTEPFIKCILGKAGKFYASIDHSSSKNVLPLDLLLNLGKGNFTRRPETIYLHSKFSHSVLGIAHNVLVCFGEHTYMTYFYVDVACETPILGLPLPWLE